MNIPFFFNNLLSFMKNRSFAKISKKQQTELDKISANVDRCIQVVLHRCKGCSNSDYIHYISLIEQKGEEQKAKVIGKTKLPNQNCK